MMPNVETDLSRLAFEIKVLEGGFERMPKLGADPVLWSIVETRLDRGVGVRVQRMMLSSPYAKGGKPLFFQPPSWWQIEGLEQAFETFDTNTEASLGWHYEPIKLRRDGALRIDRDKVTVATVRIDGDPLDVETAEAYALAWAEAQHEAGGRVWPKYDPTLRPIHQARLSK